MDAFAGRSPAPDHQPVGSPATGRLFVGMSGWNYPAWKRRFYAGLHPRQWLDHCAANFTAIEVNATFFRFMKPEMVESWVETVPPGFPFAVKGHRFVTHGERLRATAPLIARQRHSLAALDGRIAAVLWQLPQNLDRDLALLEQFATDLERAWPDSRHVIEFRNDSWFEPEVAELLESRRIANCHSIDADWPCWSEVTTDLAYLRFYPPLPGRGPRDLSAVVAQATAWRAEGRDLHIYFDSDSHGDAPYEALSLIERLS